MRKISNRRSFLATAAATTSFAWPLTSLPRAIAADRTTRLRDYPFQLGVASGDPDSNSVVIWTRLATDPVHGGGMPPEDIAVRWQVSTNEALTEVVRQGTTTANKDWAHSVHVEVEGLKPDRTYWYQFKVGNETSPLGRTRTTPTPDAAMQSLRFAFASCQQYEHGYFTAYRHMADEDLHAVVHLGDYIYEGKAATGKIRQHNSDEIKTLDEYRNRYGLYKSDPDLQAAHAAFPWIVTWDDHEFDNNYANEVCEHPGVTVEKFLQRRAAAYQAYYEHMPLRRSSLPRDAMMLLYRNVTYGRLAQFLVLDTRQYRTDQPCGDKLKLPCEDINDPTATMLGETQERWLTQSLTASPARWNILAQQVMMAHVDRVPGEVAKFSMDQWPGYTQARRRLFQSFVDHEISNPIVLTGDIHCNWVNDLKLDFNDENSPTVATELVGTSISSGGDGNPNSPKAETLLSENPCVKYFNAERGYVRCQITEKEWHTDFRVVPLVTKPRGDCLTRDSFVIESGRAGASKT